jgi:sulfite reductase beta subunit-like hemoprotein
LREIGEITRRYARNFGDVSTRQDIQLHWLTLDQFPDILDRIYNKMGMYQEFSCGDAPRNVTGCPLAGELTEKDEIVDGGPLAVAVSDMFRAGQKEFSNLPRKFKGAIAGCRAHCHAPQINCLGLFGVERKRAGGIERGFGLAVGGGLRDTPHFGQSLRVFLRPDADLIKEVCRQVAHIFRDSDELRQGRLRARLKFYVARVGWEAFRDQLEDYLGYKLEHDEDIVFPEGVGNGDHMGVLELKNGHYSVGVPVPRGRLSGDQMVGIAELAERFSAHPTRQINTTIKQNILLLNIPKADVDEVCKELGQLGLPMETHPLRASLLSCTGIQFCNLAIVETKDRAMRILDYLESRIQTEEPFFLSVTGCPNSCAQYQIADIGLQGTLGVYKGQKGVDHYNMLIGGRQGVDPKFGQYITADGKKIKVPADLVHISIENLLLADQAEKQNGDTFSDWAWRQEMSRLAELATPPED